MRAQSAAVRVGGILLCTLFCGGGFACGILREKEPDTASPVEVVKARRLSPEETEALVGTVAENWFYGRGLGEAAVNVGAIVAFPPYAGYVLGNALLDVSGYEPLYVSNLLPEGPKEWYLQTYGAVVGVPGRVAAAFAGKEYRDQDASKERLRAYLNASGTDSQRNDTGAVTDPKVSSDATTSDFDGGEF